MTKVTTATGLAVFAILILIIAGIFLIAALTRSKSAPRDQETFHLRSIHTRPSETIFQAPEDSKDIPEASGAQSNGITQGAQTPVLPTMPPPVHSSAHTRINAIRQHLSIAPPSSIYPDDRFRRSQVGTSPKNQAWAPVFERQSRFSEHLPHPDEFEGIELGRAQKPQSSVRAYVDDKSKKVETSLKDKRASIAAWLSRVAADKGPSRGYNQIE